MIIAGRLSICVTATLLLCTAAFLLPERDTNANNDVINSFFRQDGEPTGIGEPTENKKKKTKPDPTCSTGLCSGSACCPKECTKCGGPGCKELNADLGFNCCSSFIMSKNSTCTDNAPPCVVQSPFKCGGEPLEPQLTNEVGRIWKNIDDTLDGAPTARHEACFVMVKGKGYLIGGRGANRHVYIFNPKKKTWQKGPALPVQMHHIHCVHHGGKIYIPTSWFGPSPSEQTNELMYIYNINKQKWSSVEGLPEDRRRGSAASVVYKEKIWVIGGNVGGHWPPSVTTGWMDYYDLAKKKWVTGLPDLPEGRDHHGAAVVKKQICVAGGRDGGSELKFAATITSTYCYNVKKKKWKNMNAELPAGRAGAAVGRTCDGHMMVAGGEGRFLPAFNRVDVFDGKKWTQYPSMVQGRHGMGLGVSNCNKCGHIFVATGSGQRGGSPELDSTERLIPPGVKRTCKKY